MDVMAVPPAILFSKAKLSAASRFTNEREYDIILTLWQIVISNRECLLGGIRTHSENFTMEVDSHETVTGDWRGTD